MAGYDVVLDANVLYGIAVTDLFATMATKRLFRPHWSPQILDEVRRNLRLRPELASDAIDRRIAHMNRALPAALVTIPTPLIEAMPVNDKDRHVLALAVHVAAPTIVTEDLKDFPSNLLEPFGIEAVSSDAFTIAQLDLHPDTVLASIDAMSARRQRPPTTRAGILNSLERHLPTAVERLRKLPAT